MRTLTAEVSPLLWRIITVLGITMYVLAIVGVEAFTGVLSPHDPLVAASSYGVNGQWALNYDVSAAGEVEGGGGGGEHCSLIPLTTMRRRLPRRTCHSSRC